MNLAQERTGYMPETESVVFCGSGLDRAASLRLDAAAFRAARDDSRARCLLLWRGKVLVCGKARDVLGFVPPDHPMLDLAQEHPILLGLGDDGAPRFASDLTEWAPENQDISKVGAFFDPSEQRMPTFSADCAFMDLRQVMARLSPRDAELAATAKGILGWHATHGYCARCGTASELAQGGWQRVCPSCKAQHFPRCDPVVIMLVTAGFDVLLGRSRLWPEGMYSLLAGFVEPGETIEAAVRREVMEEAGIRVGAVRYLASQPWPFPSSLMLGCSGEALSRDLCVDTQEIADATWISREEVMTVLADAHPTLRPPRKGSIARFLLDQWLRDMLD